MRKIWDKLKSIENLESIIVTSLIVFLALGSVVVLQEVDKTKLKLENATIILAHNRLAKELTIGREHNLKLYAQNQEFAKGLVQQEESLQRAKDLIIKQNALINDLLQQIEELKLLNSVSNHNNNEL